VSGEGRTSRLKIPKHNWDGEGIIAIVVEESWGIPFLKQSGNCEWGKEQSGNCEGGKEESEVMTLWIDSSHFCMSVRFIVSLLSNAVVALCNALTRTQCDCTTSHWPVSVCRVTRDTLLSCTVHLHVLSATYVCCFNSVLLLPWPLIEGTLSLTTLTWVLWLHYHDVCVNSSFSSCRLSRWCCTASWVSCCWIFMRWHRLRTCHAVKPTFQLTLLLTFRASCLLL